MELTSPIYICQPFKTFTHNPSHLITTRLSPILLPSSQSSKHQPIIHLHIQPPKAPLRVSYPTISSAIPPLLWALDPDYILHLGMAAGRRHYALETLAHRDGYTIKDIDGVDGVDVGSRCWSAEGCPSVLDVGWDRSDVLWRWRQELHHDCDEEDDDGASAAMRRKEPIPDVRLSNDAGRFLCDFVFYQSLSWRWKEVHRPALLPPPPPSASLDSSPVDSDCSKRKSSSSREGKVAFLHVPGDIDEAAIDRGVRITEAAIRAIVSSWEQGYRREGRVCSTE
jgi:pyrrolidone-carboxylate peptidase